MAHIYCDHLIRVYRQGLCLILLSYCTLSSAQSQAHSRSSLYNIPLMVMMTFVRFSQKRGSASVDEEGGQVPRSMGIRHGPVFRDSWSKSLRPIP